MFRRRKGSQKTPLNFMFYLFYTFDYHNHLVLLLLPRILTKSIAHKESDCGPLSVSRVFGSKTNLFFGLKEKLTCEVTAKDLERLKLQYQTISKFLYVKHKWKDVQNYPDHYCGEKQLTNFHPGQISKSVYFVLLPN